MSRVPKYFKMDRGLKARFERLCAILGFDQSVILERLLMKWCEEHGEQVRLDLYVPSSGNIIINQPKQVNIAVKAELTYVKIELARILEVLKNVKADSNSFPEFLKQLAKLAIQANRIQTLTQDNELAQLLAEAAERFG
jgi:hypothetical protein